MPGPNFFSNSLNIFQRLFTFIGKPFYFLLSYSIVGLFVFSRFLGKILKIFLLGFLLLLVETVIKISRIIVSMYQYIETGVRIATTIPNIFVSMYRYIEKGVSETRKPKFAFPAKKRAKKRTRKEPFLKIKFFKKRIGDLPRFLLKLKFLKFKLVYALLSCLVFVFSIALFIAWQILTKDLPSPTALTTRNVEVSTKIYDKNGVLLYNIYKDKNRTPISLEEIPLRVRLATLAIEDAEFYQHPGFSVRGIFRAAVKNLKEGELTGGSTITQQLVKNTLLSPEKTLERKLREVILAVRVELEFSKDEILEMYLNEVSYGGTAYGIQTAAKVYFDKDVDKLTLAEAALLAGLPKSPTRYSPFGSNPDLAFDRQKEVLKLMKINGYITDEQLEKGLSEEISFIDNTTNIKAPHFVMYTREYLEEKYGKEVVESGGLKVITTLDYDIQKLAEKAVEEELENLKNLNVGNGAVIVIHPQTGEILAMVGSKDYFDTQSDGNVNVTTRPRQPGSSIKVVNYAYALSNGFNPASTIGDSPVKFLVPDQPPYTPKNYDGKFRGTLTLRSAFAESRNIPAVKVLASYGVEKMIDMGRGMGITTWNDPSNYGLSLTLGGGEVKLIDLAQVYATVANYGTKQNLFPVYKVTNYKGKVLEENTCNPIEEKSRFDIANDIIKNVQAPETQSNNSPDNVDKLTTETSEENLCKGEQILDPRVTYMLIDILRDNIARAPAFGTNSLLNIASHAEVAVKTGTSNNLRDNLTIGFNQKYLVAVWVGNNDNSEMSRVASGITGATPIWNKIMSALLAEEEGRVWAIPEGLIMSPYCILTGSLPCRGCPTAFDWFLEEDVPTKSCNPEAIKQILEKKEEKEKAPGPVTDPEGGLGPGGIENPTQDEVIWGQILQPAASTQR